MISDFKTFDLLKDSYNSYHHNELSRPLKSISTQGYSISLGYYFGEGSGAGLSFNRLYDDNYAQLTNGDERHFVMTLTYAGIYLSSLIRGDRLGFGIDFGGYIGRMNMDVYYQYADGTCDFGLEKFLNGQYRGQYGGISMGPRILFMFSDNLGIYVKAEYMHYVLPDELYDPDESRTQEVDHNVSSYLPTDYIHYDDIMEANLTLPSEYEAKTDLKGLRYIIGLQLFVED